MPNFKPANPPYSLYAHFNISLFNTALKSFPPELIFKILVELYNLEPKKLYFIYKHHSVAKVKENNDMLNIPTTETMTVDTY